MHDLLNDSTYRILSKNPVNRLIAGTKKIVNQISLDPPTKRTMSTVASNLPRIYGLPKIHKPSVPLRPIVNTIGSPTYQVAKFAAVNLRPLVGQTEHHVRDSAHLVEMIKGWKLQESDLLVSFDVQSLFTKLPRQECINALKLLEIPDDLVSVTEFCLNNTFFSYEGRIYEQLEGAPMGSPLSPVVADIFMEQFE